jgi:hypothetical protein
MAFTQWEHHQALSWPPKGADGRVTQFFRTSPGQIVAANYQLK